MPRTRRIRLAIAVAATLVIVGPLAWLWQDSRLPRQYSIMSMGHADHGGGAQGQHAGHDGHGGRDITTLVADRGRPADVAVTLTARQERFKLASGRTVDGYTLNGASPGPTITARAGQLVQVRLVNDNVPAGITLHWHGVDVPNAEDGVAGVTQDAVRPGAEHVYRFVAPAPGTFWYHSHQVSHEQVARGLFGALVVLPADPPTVDVVALTHVYDGVRTINGDSRDLRVAAGPGTVARVRLINSDNGPMSAWVAGTPYRVVAVDGTDVHGPTPVSDTSLLVTAGGRADLEITMPDNGSPVRVQVGGGLSVILGSGEPPRVAQPAKALDLLGYGAPAPLGFDPGAAGRTFRYEIGRRPGFVAGRPGMFWTINGHLYPDVPMYTVAEGDVVRMTIVNSSGEVHPMHLHGHHAVVLSRDGVRATGSPWWFDSLNVGDGERYEIAFVADNPGIWADHCHNLKHAADGLVAHLMYAGYTTPFLLGAATGNSPE
ncbi:multicopper oxidase family protein [Dactylosporangium sp. AC04546]|uniref:multicopper oxidase family protein n=1 Tax=Dactylosporangium sp. AC04546 TaxID=2862460 RepID=UPI001EE130EB|nr:multicopper oxidase family protein [Dactylosporangium sp. AC04546]WVK78165.1 multicopper oxidase family protein [Dactylosporangium sp. AC04546]